ncbi:MAG: monovalent cation/H(+) antiporter subunit G [Oceanicaulis sp.]
MVEMIIGVAFDVVSAVLMVTGAVFVMAGALGMLRLPDFYTRLHAAGVTDTLGAELIVIGLMLQTGWSLDTVKLALLGLFVFLTSPTATHATANAAYKAGLKPVLERFRTSGGDGEGSGL